MTKEEINASDFIINAVNLEDVRCKAALIELENEQRRKDESKALRYAVEKTAERTKREVIQKAVEWLDNNVDKYCFNSGGRFEYIPKVGRKMLEDFKQAMEDESK